jgi:Creatinase/Prolidase N-terminal domain.
MTDIANRIEQLKGKMIDKGLDAYIIPSSDPHMSEYVAPRWEGRKWASGFTGSAGTLVITRTESGLWTDGRYHIQAENQLKGSGIHLFKSGLDGVADYPDWLADTLGKGSVVGVFGQLFSVSGIRRLEKKLAPKGISVNKEHDLLEGLWTDRPDIPLNPIYIHELVYAGKSTAEKAGQIRQEMDKKGVNFYLIPSLDDVAWLFNIRGNDVEYNPVALAYGLISKDNIWLFVDSRKVDQKVRESLNENGVTVEEYEKLKITWAGWEKGTAYSMIPRRLTIGYMIP